MKMKLYTLSLALVLVLVLVGSLEARKSKKDQQKWRDNKARHYYRLSLMKKHGLKGNKINDYTKYDVPEGSDDKLQSHKVHHYIPQGYDAKFQSHKVGRYFGKKMHKGKFAKKGKKAHKAMAWLDLKSDADCDLKCKEGEVCISGPVVKKPICVHKKDLKKSMKLFHRYHKKEMKAWKKYQKRHYFKPEQKEEKYGKGHDLAELKKAKLEKLGKRVHFGKEFFHKKEKKNFNPHPKKYAGPVCSNKDMGQMKTRMMGWFHLLHGLDHDARKVHGGNIAKFTKHVSVKKELREYDGLQCQCMKSALWQFHQMDKDNDDHLTDKELAMLEENSLEPCVRPYLKSCDRNQDRKINSDEWCCCFTNVLPPCFSKLNEIRNSGKPVTYMPRCDKEGYYMHEQCKGPTKDQRVCWCVDYNGNEYKDTVTNGRAHCSKIQKYGHKKTVPLV